METVEITPAGTSTTELPKPTTGDQGGVQIIQETKDLFKNWAFHDAESHRPVIQRIDLDAILPIIEKKVLLGIVRDPQVQVMTPFPVELSRADDAVIAAWPEADEFGHGANYAEALEDLGRSISSLFRALSRDEGSLGVDLQRVLGLLRSHLRFRP